MQIVMLMYNVLPSWINGLIYDIVLQDEILNDLAMIVCLCNFVLLYCLDIPANTKKKS